MEKVIRWVLIALIGASIAWGVTQCSIKVREHKRADLSEVKYSNCINSPVKVDTLTDTLYLPSKVIIKPVPVVQKVYDTIMVPLKESWYDTTYKRNGLRFRWRAYALGSIEEITFSDFVIPYRTIRETRTVDTCFSHIEVRHVPKNHLGFDIDLSGNNFKQFPNFSLGMFWTIKDKWGINFGGEFNAYHNEFYVKGGIKIFLR